MKTCKFETLRDLVIWIDNEMPENRLDAKVSRVTYSEDVPPGSAELTIVRSGKGFTFEIVGAAGDI